jgi:hypothetical protein
MADPITATASTQVLSCGRQAVPGFVERMTSAEHGRVINFATHCGSRREVESVPVTSRRGVRDTIVQWMQRDANGPMALVRCLDRDATPQPLLEDCKKSFERPLLSCTQV